MTTGDVRFLVDNTRESIHAWQDRVRNPSLTALLVLELCAIFLAAPLAAKGLPMARAIADMLVLAVLAIVVMLSRRWDAIALILLGLAATAASFLLGRGSSSVSTAIFSRGGDILAFSALTWAVARGLCTWAYYISPPSRCGRTLFEPRDDFRLGL
jgi:membrane-bound ClpP family serine protease